jgi:hypothetical protein
MEWRTAASTPAQHDLDTLLAESITVVSEMIADRGSFAPFMLVVGSAGDKAIRHLQSPSVDEPVIRDMLTLTDDRTALRARATVFDVMAEQPISGNAIKVLAEHREGIAISVLVPYFVQAQSVRINMNAANAAATTPHLWLDGGTA